MSKFNHEAREGRQLVSEEPSFSSMGSGVELNDWGGHCFHSSSGVSEFWTLCCFGRVHCRAFASILYNCEEGFRASGTLGMRKGREECHF